jgi:hypothetical protein
LLWRGGGYYYTPNFHYIAEILKTDSNGNLKWKKTFGNPSFNNGKAILCLSKDSCIVATYSIAYSSLLIDYRQVYVTKISQNGDEKWNKKIGFPAINIWPSWIESLNDNCFILCGNNVINDTVTKHIGWLFKLKSNGDSLWYREYSIINGINDANEIWQVIPTPDKGFAAAGSLYPNVGNQDIWVFKTDSMGCLVPNCNVCITEFNPNAGAQMLIFPNPFTNAFAINYNIPAGNKEAVFELRDIMGKLVYSTPLTININQLQVVASSLKAGMYVGCLVVDRVVVSSEKIVKL